MGPEHGLPLPRGYTDDESYVNDLLHFVTTTELLQTLVGGVHILDFFVNTPDLYERVIDSSWRAWFATLEIDDFLDFCLRADVDALLRDADADADADTASWRGRPRPPTSLLRYVAQVRRLTLVREFRSRGPFEKMPPAVRMGMTAKKIHEVDNFARYVQRLAVDLDARQQGPRVRRLVDFGAGQGYLGRFLASRPWNRHVVALEGKSHNVDNAKMLDMQAKLRGKDGVMRNKKAHRAKLAVELAANGGQKMPKQRADFNDQQPMRIARPPTEPAKAPVFVGLETPTQGSGSVQHVEYRLDNGDLDDIIRGVEQHDGTRTDEDEVEPTSIVDDADAGSMLVMSLHSCGQLSHHALRSLTLNPAVGAVAVVGCCYNLMTERLSAPSYKMPSLRPESQPTSLAPGAEGDPHGFPMSARLCEYDTPEGKGLQVPITARMMAVQAPTNWGTEDCADFFTRHFYRALLQRVFLDCGLVERPVERQDPGVECMIVGGRSPAGSGGSTQPVVIGKLARKAYSTFSAYVRAALAKLETLDARGPRFQEKAGALSDEQLEEYARAFGPRKKELSIVWTLMAYSAQLVEAVIVVDRYLWLKEQDEVAECWVEPVFDYAESPRNLVVVGVKR